jgi:hypothetical protein
MVVTRSLVIVTLLDCDADGAEERDVRPALFCLAPAQCDGMCNRLAVNGVPSLEGTNPKFRPDRDAFASTLTSLDDNFSLKWESSAALPGDRIEALKRFHERGIYTWVSLEPTLDVESSLAIVRATHSFVDIYKVGRVNYLPMTKTTDWRDYTLRMGRSPQRGGSRSLH